VSRVVVVVVVVPLLISLLFLEKILSLIFS
jgi:hypothetical protein